MVLLDTIKESLSSYAVKLHAFVILPDHLHLLVTPTMEKFTISDFMKGIKGKSAIEINRCRHEFIRAKAKGTVKTVPTNDNTKTRIWQHQFLDHVVRDEEDYRKHIEYIHNNPVKHNLCKEPWEYRWSSYRYYMNNEDVIVQIDKLPL